MNVPNDPEGMAYLNTEGQYVLSDGVRADLIPVKYLEENSRTTRALRFVSMFNDCPIDSNFDKFFTLIKSYLLYERGIGPYQTHECKKKEQ